MKILFVDDDRDVVKIVERHLKKKGFEVSVISQNKPA